MAEGGENPGLIILGACGGIGRALVVKALSRGWRVAAIDLPASLDRWPPPDGVPRFAADATDAGQMARAAMEAADALGKTSGFVNLSGYLAGDATVTETPPEVWRDALDGNLTAAFLAAQSVAPLLAEGGSIVFTGSGLGHLARPGYGPYAISKAGIAMLTKQLATELAPRLRVNSVAPSAVDTAFLRGGTGRSKEDARTRIDIDTYASSVPLRRIATPADVVGPILFLLSNDARYITGQTLHVNGGTYMP